MYGKRAGHFEGYEHRFTLKEFSKLILSTGLKVVKFDSEYVYTFDDALFAHYWPAGSKIGIMRLLYRVVSKILFRANMHRSLQTGGARIGVIGQKQYTRT